MPTETSGNPRTKSEIKKARIGFALGNTNGFEEGGVWFSLRLRTKD